ncbi:MAG: ComEC/Rec2 family competence protein, partial [Verrucomicrobiota bacterium]
ASLLSRKQRWFDKGIARFLGGFSVSVAAWLGSALLLSAHFRMLSPVGVVANIIMVPLASGIVIVALLAIIFYSIKLSFITVGLNFINALLAFLLAWLAQGFASFPGAFFHTGSYSKHSQPPLQLIVGGLGSDHFSLLTTPAHNWLIDTGGERTFQQQVLPLLRSRGINSLEGLILSHGDQGHIGQSDYLLNHIRPQLLLHPPIASRSTLPPRILSAAGQQGVPSVAIERYDKIHFSPEVTGIVLYPPANQPRGGVADDSGLVIKFKVGEWRLLYTFDAGFEIEKWLLKNPDALRCDLWIRGQHARTPSGTQEFIQAVQPKVILSSHDNLPDTQAITPEWKSIAHATAESVITLDEAGTVKIEVLADQIIVTPFRQREPIFITKD